MRLLELPQPFRHAAWSPATPNPLSQGIVHPIVCQVRLDLRTRLKVLSKGGYDLLASSGVFQVTPISEPDTVCAIFLLCPVMVRK